MRRSSWVCSAIAVFCLFRPCLTGSATLARSKFPSEKGARFGSLRSFHDWPGRATLRSSGPRRTSRYRPRG